MIALTLLLQLAASTEPDSRYTAPALRDFVVRAAAVNQAPPPQLQGYTARLESELALIMRDTLGRDELGQVEQLAARANWKRDGQYQVHVVGYRSLMGIMYSALTFTRMYSVPTLFGNRLAFGINDGLSRTKKDSVHRAVHPLAADRDTYYRFRGGDTVATLHSFRLRRG